MGGLVEGMISGSVQALVDRDSNHAELVIANDNEVDRLQMKLDEACYDILARMQPIAIDLRFIVAVTKIATDLERMGDSAVNVAQAVLVLNHEPQLKPYIDLPRLSVIVQSMVRDALDSFVHRNTTPARGLPPRRRGGRPLQAAVPRAAHLHDRGPAHRSPGRCICCSSRATSSASPITPPTSARTSSTTSRGATSATWRRSTSPNSRRRLPKNPTVSPRPGAYTRQGPGAAVVLGGWVHPSGATG